MTPDEVREWVQYHGGCYPGYLSWIAKRPNGPAFMEGLERTLRDCTLPAAKEASRQMSQSEQQPKSPADHARLIRARCQLFSEEVKRIARKARNARFGEETFDCPDCHDTGFVSVPLAGSLLAMAQKQIPRWRVNWDGIEKATADHLAMLRNKRMSVRCKCSRPKQQPEEHPDYRMAMEAMP